MEPTLISTRLYSDIIDAQLQLTSGHPLASLAGRTSEALPVRIWKVCKGPTKGDIPD